MKIEQGDIEIVDYEETGEARQRPLDMAHCVAFSYRAGTNSDIVAGDQTACTFFSRILLLHRLSIVNERILPALNQFIYLAIHQKFLGQHIDSHSALASIRSIAQKGGNGFVDAFNVTRAVMDRLEDEEKKINAQAGLPFTLHFRAYGIERGKFVVYAELLDWKEDAVSQHMPDRPKWLTEKP